METSSETTTNIITPPLQNHSMKRTVIVSIVGILVFVMILGIGIGVGYLYSPYKPHISQNKSVAATTNEPTVTPTPSINVIGKQVGNYFTLQREVSGNITDFASTDLQIDSYVFDSKRDNVYFIKYSSNNTENTIYSCSATNSSCIPTPLIAETQYTYVGGLLMSTQNTYLAYTVGKNGSQELQGFDNIKIYNFVTKASKSFLTSDNSYGITSNTGNLSAWWVDDTTIAIDIGYQEVNVGSFGTDVKNLPITLPTDAKKLTQYGGYDTDSSTEYDTIIKNGNHVLMLKRPQGLSGEALGVAIVPTSSLSLATQEATTKPNLFATPPTGTLHIANIGASIDFTQEEYVNKPMYFFTLQNNSIVGYCNVTACKLQEADYTNNTFIPFSTITNTESVSSTDVKYTYMNGTIVECTLDQYKEPTIIVTAPDTTTPKVIQLGIYSHD